MSFTIITPLRAGCRFRRRNFDVLYNHTRDVCERLGARWIVAEAGEYAKRPGVDHVPIVGHFSRASGCNAGLAITDSEFVAILDADAIMRPSHWAKCFDAARRFDFYSPGRRKVHLGKRQTLNRVVDGWYQFDIPHGNTSRRSSLCDLLFFARFDALEQIGGFDERFTAWGFEDAALHRMARLGKFKIGFGKSTALHLFHETCKGQRHSMRRLFRVAYHGRPFAEIVAAIRDHRQKLAEAK